ncbi:MFS transporter [Bacillus subtilis]|nr:MFS transporter [Bacillus subtilis]
MPFLYIGRMLSGLAAEIYVATGTVSVMENAPSGDSRLAGSVATAANIGGAGSGILLAGFAAQYFTAALFTPFLVHAVLTVIASIALIPVRERVSAHPASLRLRLPSIPPESRSVFVAAAPGAITGYAVLGLFSAVSPSFLDQKLAVSSTAGTATVVFLFYGFSGLAQILLRNRADRTLMLIGTIALIVSMGALGLALVQGLLLVLVMSSSLGGDGQGLLFMTGVRAIARSTAFENQAGATTAYFVLAYLSIAVPIIGVGLVMVGAGLVGSTLIFAAAIIVGCAWGLLGLGAFSKGLVAADTHRGK